MDSESLAEVRAEIKAWERKFKAENGAVPSTQDIRNNPTIAAKYKLYKQLGKLASMTASTTAQPVTPPRLKPAKNQSTLGQAKSRVAEPTESLAAFNPFSPQKKGKQRQPAYTPAEKSRFNPFASPVKIARRTPSSDPFGPSTYSQSSSSLMFPQPATPIARARKRLRGDPVSPSPNKQKRQRLGSVDPPSLFQEAKCDHAESGDNDKDAQAGNSSFVEDSPVKQGSRPLDLLFHDATDIQSFPSMDLPTEDPVMQEVLPQVRPDVKNDMTKQPKKMTTMKNILYSQKDPRKDVVIVGTEMLGSETPLPSPADISSLIPPSPPPPEASSSNGPVQSKNKKAARKTNVDRGADDGSEMDTDDEELKGIKLFRRHEVASHPVDGDLEFPSYHGTATAPSLNASDNDDIQHIQRLAVDLPDKLRHVLALSSNESRSRVVQEETIVASLVYGRREVSYDPIRGGEIWDIGEEPDGRQAVDTENDDEWEGPPIPWEVGEL